MKDTHDYLDPEQWEPQSSAEEDTSHDLLEEPTENVAELQVKLAEKTNEPKTK